MKALSMKQPWGSLVAAGIKTIETRTWQTDYRGDILFCTSKKTDYKGTESLRNFLSAKGKHICLAGFENVDIPLGVTLCIAELYDILPMVEEDEIAACCYVYPGAYSWCLRNIRVVNQIPFKGQLRLFNVDDKIIEMIK